MSTWKKMEKPELGDDVHRSAFTVYLMNVHKECRLTDPCQQSSCGLGEKGRHNSYFFFPIWKKGQDAIFNPLDNKHQDSRRS